MIFTISLLSAGFSMHQAFAQRSPSVEPMTEVSIEENRTAPETGFNFEHKKTTSHKPATRVPANIATKAASAPYSFIGPMIFLIALPLALWIVVSRKMKSNVADKKVDYYPKTFQFKSHKSDFQDQDESDDQDFPKAS